MGPCLCVQYFVTLVILPPFVVPSCQTGIEEFCSTTVGIALEAAIVSVKEIVVSPNQERREETKSNLEVQTSALSLNSAIGDT